MLCRQLQLDKVYYLIIVLGKPGTSRNEAIGYYMDLAIHAPQKECQRYLKIVDDLRKGKNNCGQNF